MVWLFWKKITKSLPLGWTNICVLLLYGHIFCIGLDLGQYSDYFISRYTKNPLRGVLNLHIEAYLKKIIYADIPGILL